MADEIDIVTKDLSKEDEDALKDVDPQYANGDVVGQELEVEETIVLEERGPELWKTLLTGLPSPTSLAWSTATFLINVLLVYMVWDFTFKGTLFHQAYDLSLARVGYVSDTTANILIREPDANKLPVFVSYRHADRPLSTVAGLTSQVDAAWKSGGQIAWLDNSTDFTGTFALSGLSSDTRYQYVVSNNHTGFFVTAPRPGYKSTRLPNTGTFNFVHSSCLKNNFPYNPFAHSSSNSGLRYLAQALPALRAQFMLFLGESNITLSIFSNTKTS